MILAELFEFDVLAIMETWLNPNITKRSRVYLGRIDTATEACSLWGIL